MKHPWSSHSFRRQARSVGRSDSIISAAQIAANAIKRVHPDLPVVFTLHHLCHLTGVSSHILQRVTSRKEDAYRVFRVKKRGSPGGSAPSRHYRTICIPYPALMRVQCWIAQNILNPISPHQTSFAFAPNRDLVGAATRHLEAKWLLKMDVRHFFESISERRVYRVFRSLGYGALLAFQMARLCTRLRQNPLHLESVLWSETGLPYSRRKQGHLPQGAPTSPMLANLVMRELDSLLDAIAREDGWIYTRYADDLAFSRRDRSTRGAAMRLAKRVERALVSFGLENHKQKTIIVPPGARKILLGVSVESERPRLTRAFRNNIETHLFALNSDKIGPAAHRLKRGFASTIGMRRHVEGLIAFAHQVDPAYAQRLYGEFNNINWSR